MCKRSLGILLLGLLILAVLPPSQAQAPPKPLILPVIGPPGPNTWLMGQPYGNTPAAYNFGYRWYVAGQGLHFGVDFSMPCGTPVVAVADGEVHAVDAGSFGSAPHNVIIVHRDLGLVSLYGHLGARSTLVNGQPVRQGEVIGISGEPRAECGGRPHLHLEIRSSDFRTTYNPVPLIDAPWHTLATIGGFSNYLFQQDLENTRRWMTLSDQPDVRFGGNPLNNYNRTWPYRFDIQPPPNPPIPRTLPPLESAGAWTARQIGFGGCCPRPWWHVSDSNRFYVIDGVIGQRANVFEYTLDASQAPTIIEPAPPMLLSPDGTHQVTRVDGQVTIRRLADGASWRVQTQGVLPALSTDNSRLAWEVARGTYFPGDEPPTMEFWTSASDGSGLLQIGEQAGGDIQWLDAHRLLITSPIAKDQPDLILSVYDTRDNSQYVLGQFQWVRGLSVAPGGERLLFYLVMQALEAQNGLYVLETQAGATPQKLPFFGGWRWRDADSLYYLPLEAGERGPDTAHRLAYYHIPTGTNFALTDPTRLPFVVADNDWAVSPDGDKILFMNAKDLNLWLLERQP